MRKNILFVLPTYEIGGTVVSTKNLLLLLDPDRYNITVLSMTGVGHMKASYDDYQQISSSFILSSLTHASWKNNSGYFKKIIGAVLRKLASSRVIRKLLLASQTDKLVGPEYDIVVACQEGICTEFVSYIKSKKKVAWVRCDYARYVMNLNVSIEAKIYSKFNSIICVSDLVCERFKTIHPQFKLRTIAVQNPQSEAYILQQANIDDEDQRFQKKGYTIVSIGRFDPIKRFTLIPSVASFLCSKNIEFRWYIIGDGSKEEKEKIIENIISEKVETNVICLGVKTNPHFYIKHSDLLVCLSSSEACPRVINEAKILHVPVVCANFDTAAEYIDHMETGLISTIDEIKFSILEILNNKDLTQRIKENISQFRFDNDYILSKINQVFSCS